MSAASIAQILFLAIPAIIAITLHEAAHGYAARHFGDHTAEQAGRITLNPIRHIDPFGTIVLPALLILSNTGLIFGYAKPVPVNANALRNPRMDMMWVAAAGPGMNVLLAAISALLLLIARAAFDSALLENLLRVSIALNFILAIFNLLPLPPLDGSKVVAALIPEALVGPYVALERYGILLLLIVLIILPLACARLGMDWDVVGPLVLRPAYYLTDLFTSLAGGQ
jgi:Zn-dependent protease